jgi:DNA-binding FadR family transcriptional regulator
MWKAGDRIPAEREIARLLRVSRVSVREAIVMLQLDGVLETRHGSGTVVTGQGGEIAAAIVHGATRRVPRDDVSPDALLEAREAIDGAVAASAARRKSHDKVAEELLLTMSSPANWEDAEQRHIWSDADRLFHRQLTVMTENPVFIQAGAFIAEVMDQALWQRLRDETLRVDTRIAGYAAEHKAIYDAIVEGNARNAARLAVGHVKAVRRHMRLVERYKGEHPEGSDLLHQAIAIGLGEGWDQAKGRRGLS